MHIISLQIMPDVYDDAWKYEFKFASIRSTSENLWYWMVKQYFISTYYTNDTYFHHQMNYSWLAEYIAEPTKY